MYTLLSFDIYTYSFLPCNAV